MLSEVNLVGLLLTSTLNMSWIRDTRVENLRIFFLFFPLEINKKKYF